MSRKEVNLHWFKKFNHIYFTKNKQLYFGEKKYRDFFWGYFHQGITPNAMSLSMFKRAIELMGTDE